MNKKQNQHAPYIDNLYKIVCGLECGKCFVILSFFLFSITFIRQFYEQMLICMLRTKRIDHFLDWCVRDGKVLGAESTDSNLIKKEEKSYEYKNYNERKEK